MCGNRLIISRHCLCRREIDSKIRNVLRRRLLIVIYLWKLSEQRIIREQFGKTDACLVGKIMLKDLVTWKFMRRRKGGGGGGGGCDLHR